MHQRNIQSNSGMLKECNVYNVDLGESFKIKPSSPNVSLIKGRTSFGEVPRTARLKDSDIARRSCRVIFVLAHINRLHGQASVFGPELFEETH